MIAVSAPLPLSGRHAPQPQPHAPAPKAASLTDAHGRTMRKLRLSVTEACQFRCFYCMPEGSPQIRREGMLDAAGYARLVRILAEGGIRQVRVTGGEPTLRPDLLEIFQALSEIPGLELSLTTNGELLPPLLPGLRACGVRGVNISLDSLDPETFHTITRRPLEPVLKAIRQSVAQGFQVKLNSVVCRGRNDHEAPAFAAFAAAEGVEVRFLELMKIGPGGRDHARDFVPAHETQALLRTRFSLTPLAVPGDSTAFRFRLDNGAAVGFIASESRPFCGGCSRLRLSARGELRPCLMKDEKIPLAPLPDAQILQAARGLLPLKPAGRIESLDQPMHAIGG